MTGALERLGARRGLPSVCSSHPLVLRAAIRAGLRAEGPVLIEATCNQVNHRGGYTRLDPTRFAERVRAIAADEGLPQARLLLGGDHLGPNPWRDRSVDEAMDEAETMVRAYAAAGFRKLHLDCSMGCAGEPEALGDVETARRAARLAAAAEEVAEVPPLYVIGTEVPPPGGADHALDSVTPTDPDAAWRTYEIHRETFAAAGLSDAFGRVVALVVQPGVEFGNRNVIRYDPGPAEGLSAVLGDMPGLVFEAHSTDYQGEAPLAALVRDGFAILKVGPELTFALREALYGLDALASDLVRGYGERPLRGVMERLMVADPSDWERHYGEPDTYWLRHHSLSDRIRYYWDRPEARAAVARLTEVLRGRALPLPLIWQHLPWAEGMEDADPDEIVIARVGRSLDAYQRACAPG